MFYNNSEDKTYENWLALYACLENSNLSVDKALSKVLGKNRFDERKKVKWNKEEISFVKDNYKKSSVTDLSNLLDKPQFAIRYMVRKLNLTGTSL